MAKQLEKKGSKKQIRGLEKIQKRLARANMSYHGNSTLTQESFRQAAASGGDQQYIIVPSNRGFLVVGQPSLQSRLKKKSSLSNSKSSNKGKTIQNFNQSKKHLLYSDSVESQIDNLARVKNSVANRSQENLRVNPNIGHTD